MNKIKGTKSGYIKGALTISIGGFISKLLGAAYRIPLVAILGGEGMGIYQMVYPLYCILLTVSSSGIPTGIARLISSGGGCGAEKRAFYLYGGIGLIGSLMMFALSSPLAAVQGEGAVAVCCRLLSPSVFFVAIISVVRGYFQGKGDMAPTALTEIMEQGIKVVAGIALASLFKGDVYKATAAAVLAVSVSEALCCIISIAIYYGANGGPKPLYRPKCASASSILYYTVPLTFTAIALPTGQLLESIVAVNILRRSFADATALYGIFSGCAVTVVNLPVSMAYGLAAASVPNLSPLAAKGDIKAAKGEAARALLYTLILALPCAVALYALAPVAAKIIFPSLKDGQRQLFIKLVKIMSVNAVTCSVVQTSSACITSLGRPLFSTATQWASAIVRVCLSALLAAYTPLSVVGIAISANCAYFVAVVLNFCYIIMVKSKEEYSYADYVDRIRSGRGRLERRG